MDNTGAKDGFNVVNLAERLAVDPTTRSAMAIMAAGAEITGILKEVLPTLAHREQKALLAVIAFRVMGGMLPASLEMLRRLPQFAGEHPENIGIAFDFLTGNGVLEVQVNEDETESAFYWPALERLIVNAIQAANTSPIVGADGLHFR